MINWLRLYFHKRKCDPYITPTYEDLKDCNGDKSLVKTFQCAKCGKISYWKIDNVTFPSQVSNSFVCRRTKLPDDYFTVEKPTEEKI